MKDPLDSDDENLPAVNINQEVEEINNQYRVTYAQDELDSFNDFIKLSTFNNKNIIEVTKDSPIEVFQESDADMLHKQACVLHLSITKVRTIDDATKVNKALIDFMYARRDLLCKNKPEGGDDDWSKPL